MAKTSDRDRVVKALLNLQQKAIKYGTAELNSKKEDNAAKRLDSAARNMFTVAMGRRPTELEQKWIETGEKPDGLDT